MGRDWMGWVGMGWDGMRWVGMGWDWMDGLGWMGWDGVGLHLPLIPSVHRSQLLPPLPSLIPVVHSQISPLPLVTNLLLLL